MAYRQIAAPQGMGCAGLGCPAGGTGCGCAGMGLFESGTDFTQWGLPEWGIVFVGVYMLFSTVFTTGRAVTKVRALPGERRKRRAKALRAEATELSRKKSGWF